MQERDRACCRARSTFAASAATGSFGATYGPWLVVENPLSTGAHDRSASSLLLPLPLS